MSMRTARILSSQKQTLTKHWKGLVLALSKLTQTKQWIPIRNSKMRGAVNSSPSCGNGRARSRRAPPPFRSGARPMAWPLAWITTSGLSSSRGAMTEPCQRRTRGLIGRTWVEFPRFLKSDKSGAMMARFNVTKSSRFATQFLLNGKRVELEKVKEFLYASEYAKREDFTTFDLTIDNIYAVRA